MSLLGETIQSKYHMAGPAIDFDHKQRRCIIASTPIESMFRNDRGRCVVDESD